MRLDSFFRQPEAAMSDESRRTAVILFADLMDSAEIANNMDLQSYVANVLDEFHRLSLEVARKYLPAEELTETVVEAKGDELCLILHSETMSTRQKLFAVLRIARELKIRWMLSDVNIGRVRDGKRPADVAIGINVGDVLLASKLRMSGDRELAPEGYAISLAKRIEGSARECGEYTSIMFCRRAYQEALENEVKVQWADAKQVRLKGFSQAEYVYEIKCFYGYIYWDRLPELVADLKKDDSLFLAVFENDHTNIWLGLEIATLRFYQQEYDEAVDILKKILHAAGDIPAVFVLLGACTEQRALREAKEGSTEYAKLLLREAEAYFREAIRLDPDIEDGHVELGLLLYHQHVLVGGQPDRSGQQRGQQR